MAGGEKCGFGGIYARCDHFDDAVAAYEKGIELNPQAVAARVGLADAFRRSEGGYQQDASELPVPGADRSLPPRG